MKPNDLLRLVARNLARTRFRAGLSATGVVVGTAAIVVLISLSAGLQAIATRNLGSLGPLNEINVLSLGGGEGGGDINIVIVGVDTRQAKKLKQADLDALAERPGVAAITPVVNYQGRGELVFDQFIASAQLRGVDPEGFARLNPELESGALDLGRWQVVVGAKVGETFSDPTVRSGDNRAPRQDLYDQTLLLRLTRQNSDGTESTRVVRLHVAGVLAPRGFEYDYSIFMRLADVEELNTWTSGQQVNRALSGYGQARILMTDAQAQAQLESELQEQGFLAISPNQILKQINQTYAVLQAVVGGIGVVVFVIAGIGIANTLITAIYERTAEIGLMKAVGATSQQVTWVFLAEAAAIGGGGGLAGLGLGGLLSQAADVILRQAASAQFSGAGGAPESFVVTPLWMVIVAPLFAAGVGMLAGLYPARRAAALDPVVALRSE